jgi:serine/threonine-protein kinase RsbW
MTSARSLPWSRFERTIPSSLKQVDVLCHEIRPLLKTEGLGPASFASELAARECLNNAVVHGNQSDAAKQVALRLHCTRQWVRLQVTDEGPGFDWRRARRRPLPDDQNMAGRGLALISAYADRVCFNRHGNQITLWWCRKSQQEKEIL